jgi:Ca2+-binding EF-hand superfamily protein
MLQPLAGLVILAFAGGPDAQRGNVSSVTVGRGATDAAVVLTVRGANPCRTITIDYGDGTAQSHDVGSLPATIPYAYTATGTYRVVVRGVSTCGGAASATVRATVANVGGGPGRGRGRGTNMRFWVMDRNGDGRITRQEWRGSDQSFRVHDWNGDGVLTGDEVQAAARQQQEFGDDFLFNDWTREGFRTLDVDRNNRITTNEWYYDSDLFARVDTNNDNVLTVQEFLAGDIVAPEARFDDLDLNRNGYIERSEWRSGREAFDWLDRNNDGVLTRDEIAAEPGGDSTQFNSLDVNRDNVLTRDEWHGSWLTFQRRDANRDGRITRAEFGTTGTTSGETITLTIPGNQQWTDTGLTVRAGDLLTFDANGTVYMTRGDDDSATPRGSQTGRVASGAVLPRELAGALIARVENAAPMLIGDRRTSVRMPRDGRLFLGVNDDYFGDNRGEFRVTVSIQR